MFFYVIFTLSDFPQHTARYVTQHFVLITTVYRSLHYPFTRRHVNACALIVLSARSHTAGTLAVSGGSTVKWTVCSYCFNMRGHAVACQSSPVGPPSPDPVSSKPYLCRFAPGCCASCPALLPRIWHVHFDSWKIGPWLQDCDSTKIRAQIFLQNA